jgi:hypothetical protein
MIDLNDLQKPSVAVLVIGAAATAGFVAGFLFGRNPEMAQGMVRAVANGFTRLQVTAAEAWENLGDAWAEARAESQRDIEAERFAEAGAGEPPEVPVGSATTAVTTAAATGAATAAAGRRRGTGAVRKKAPKAAKKGRPALRRVPRRKAPDAVVT